MKSLSDERQTRSVYDNAAAPTRVRFRPPSGALPLLADAHPTPFGPPIGIAASYLHSARIRKKRSAYDSRIRAHPSRCDALTSLSSASLPSIASRDNMNSPPSSIEVKGPLQETAVLEAGPNDEYNLFLEIERKMEGKAAKRLMQKREVL